jgi:hypothetical protein
MHCKVSKVFHMLVHTNPDLGTGIKHEPSERETGPAKEPPPPALMSKTRYLTSASRETEMCVSSIRYPRFENSRNRKDCATTLPP